MYIVNSLLDNHRLFSYYAMHILKAFLCRLRSCSLSEEVATPDITYIFAQVRQEEWFIY